MLNLLAMMTVEPMLHCLGQGEDVEKDLRKSLKQPARACEGMGKACKMHRKAMKGSELGRCASVR